MTSLERMRSQAVLLDRRPTIAEELAELQVQQERGWADRLGRLRESGAPIAAGETQNYHETRNPYKQTADYGAITLSTTSLSILPIASVLVGSALQFPAGYWDLGKKIRVRMFCKVTTVLTPGNFTFEIRYDTAATPTDAGGTILVTSAATAFTASKTNLPLEIDFSIEARAMIGTAAPLFAKGKVLSDGAGALITAPGNPIFLPASAPAAVNVDTTKASTIHIDVKRSGSTAETIAVHDFQVDALT
jgi:hypothetical protein